jgi:hypothetical protein
MADDRWRQIFAFVIARRVLGARWHVDLATIKEIAVFLG